MKTLTFKKKETSQPLAVSKEDVEKLKRDGKTRILLNGILTAIFSTVSVSEKDVQLFKTALISLIEKLMYSGKEVEVEVDGTTVITGEVDGENYVFSTYTIKPEYTEE